MKSKTLVIGGTGKTGRKVVAKLTDMGEDVRVGSRAATPAFDWQKPENWSEALHEITQVYITFQPDLAVPGALDAIEALVQEAKKAGVQKLVLLSGKGEREAELCEQVVIHSGLEYTIVRATWFMENFSESFFLDPIVAGHVALPKPEAKVPYVSTDDIADVVVTALTENHHGKTFDLTGPELLSFEEIVAKISQASGRDIAFTPISLAAYIAMLEEFQVPKDYIWLINYLFTEVLGTPGNDMVTQDVEQVLNRPATSFDQYVAQTVKSGVWNPEMVTQ